MDTCMGPPTREGKMLVPYWSLPPDRRAWMERVMLQRFGHVVRTHCDLYQSEWDGGSRRQGSMYHVPLTKNYRGDLYHLALWVWAHSEEEYIYVEDPWDGEVKYVASVATRRVERLSAPKWCIEEGVT